VADVGGKFPIAIAATDDQQDARPILGDEVLNERVSQHSPAGGQVEDVGAAICTSQPIVGGGCIEDGDWCGLWQSSHREQFRRREIGNDEADVASHQVAEGSGHVTIRRCHAFDKLEGLGSETPRRIVIGDAEAHPLDTLISRRPIEVSMRHGAIGPLRQPADLHGLLCSADSACRHGDQPPSPATIWAASY